MSVEKISYQLPNFEGPIELLLQLIKREELEIENISVADLAKQCINRISYDQATDFIYHASLLLLWKSRKLLPLSTIEEDEPLEIDDPEFSIIHHLIDYCHFKEVAKELTQLEEDQKGVYIRSSPPLPDFPKKLGIEHLSLEDLAKLFETVLQKAAATPETIQEEVFRVSDQILFIRRSLNANSKIPFEELFAPSKPKSLLIVSFLAILELMKLGELKMIKELKSGAVMLTKP